MSRDTFVAYRLQAPHLDLVPAHRRRGWMDQVPGNNAYRCLPMLIANQAGWVLHNSGTVTVTWDGGLHRGDCKIRSHGCPDPPVSQFGSGVVTWRIPFLFRTPLGWNLQFRGPANAPKDGASSLEGIVETDWTPAPTFHSWKLTHPDHPVTWEDGEPICMIVPQRRHELESWRPVIREIYDLPELAAEYGTFSSSRTHFNGTRRGNEWQKDYFLGRSPGTSEAPPGVHQTRLELRPFEDWTGVQSLPGYEATEVIRDTKAK